MADWKEICEKIAKLEDWEFVENSDPVSFAMCMKCSTCHASPDNSKCQRCENAIDNMCDQNLETPYECYFKDGKGSLVGFGNDGVHIECQMGPTFFKYFGSPQHLARSYFEGCRTGKNKHKAKSYTEVKLMLAIEGKDL